MNMPPPAANLGDLLGQCLRPHAPAIDQGLWAATIRCLWDERAHGHVCLPLADWQGRASGDTGALFPPVAAWRDALLGSGACGPASDQRPGTPLVLDAANRLYLRRDFVAERTIVAWVQRQLQRAELLTADVLRATLADIGLSPGPGSATDWQLVAIAAAARSSFAVITGGPGTGKTTTVARLLAALLRQQHDLRIALCAPTGKAASRLHESMRQRAAEDRSAQGVAERCQPTTLHRLLGYLPGNDSFRAGRGNALRHDVVVVDEASMADPALLATLCDAMPEHARLVLVGDRDQLAAVAAGQVLGDLCHAAAGERGCGPALAAFVQRALGFVLPTRADAPAIADHVVHLRTNYRFASRPGIGGFATALSVRDSARAFAALQSGHGDLVLAPDAERALAPFLPAIPRAARGDASDVLARAGAFRVLTATRHGRHGSTAWNERIEALLRSHGVRVEEPWYLGRPILVTTNDHQNHVYNGDLGIVVAGADGRPQVAFPRGDGSVRLVAPRRLPAHETAWAMTVHKAQGSEFDEVLVVMPERDGPLWQASLLYTAVTRAKQRAVVLADPQLLAVALDRWPARTSGLADALVR